jgi:hypothetical protein
VEVLSGITGPGGRVAAWPMASVTAQASVDVRLEHWQPGGLPAFAPCDHDPRVPGPPQPPAAGGRVIRPVLANLDVSVLDRYWTQQNSALGHLTRYADDRLIVGRMRGAAEQALQAVTQV